MVKNNLNDIFSDLDSETSLIIPKSIKIKNIKSVDTISNNTSSDIPQKGGHLESYSSSFIPQKKEHFASSNKKNNKGINLMNIQYDATNESYYTTNSTDTEQLKDKLFNILQSGGEVDDHTHIIYACCLIDINVVLKIKDLMKNTPDKKYRVYLNCNPFNIFGTRVQGGVFGSSSYSGVIELHRLFRKTNILDKNIFELDTILTYDIVHNFIMKLKEMNIILIDAPDYLVKSWLIEKEIALKEAIKVVNESKLITGVVERGKIITFLKEREAGGKSIKIPFEWYETYLPTIPFEHANETYGFDRINKNKEPIPDNFGFINKITSEYKEKYIDILSDSSFKYDPIRIFEHKRLLTELINKYGPKDEAKKDVKDVLLQILENPDVNTAFKIYPQFIPNKAFIVTFQKWVSSIYFQQKAPKVLFDFVGFLFICINGNINNLIIPDEIMPENLVAQIIDVEKLQRMIINECKTNKSDDPHAAVLPLIKNIKNKHTNLNQVTLIIDCESDDLLTTMVCNEHLPTNINLNVVIQKNIVDVEFDTVKQYLDNLTIHYKNPDNKQISDTYFEEAIKNRNTNLTKVTRHEKQINTTIENLQNQLNNFIEGRKVEEAPQENRINNITNNFIIEISKINLRFILSKLERHLTIPVYFNNEEQKEIKRKLDSDIQKLINEIILIPNFIDGIDGINVYFKDDEQKQFRKNPKKINELTIRELLSELTKFTQFTIKINSQLQFESLDIKPLIFRKLVNLFKYEIIKIATNEYKDEVKYNKDEVKNIFQNHIQIIYPFIKKDIIKMFIKLIDDFSVITNKNNNLTYTYINNVVLLLISNSKENLKNIKFKENDFQNFYVGNEMNIGFKELYQAYNFFIDKFKERYTSNRTNYFEISLDFHEKIENIKAIIPDIKYLDLIYEFFEIDKSNVSIMQPVQDKISLSPNILKVADTLLQLFKDDKIIKDEFIKNHNEQKLIK
jgi:hypothetical protein